MFMFSFVILNESLGKRVPFPSFSIISFNVLLIEIRCGFVRSLGLNVLAILYKATFLLSSFPVAFCSSTSNDIASFSLFSARDKSSSGAFKKP